MSGRAGALAPVRTDAAAGRSLRGERALWAFIGLAVAALAVAAARGGDPTPVLAVFAVPLVLVAGQRTFLAWQTLVGAIVVVILFIPIRRYTIGGGMPIELEPYRVLIAIVLACWLFALAADPAVTWRPTGFAAPIAALTVAIVGSLALNVGRVSAMSDVVVKQVSFFASYFLVLAFVASVIRAGAQLDRMLRVLVGGGAVLACFALYEWRTGVNSFNGLGSVLPFLTFQDQGEAWHRGTGIRALASAQHPIALGAALVMLVPLAIYLYKRSQRAVWLVAGTLLTFAALSTNSRTAAVMLVAQLVSFAWIKRGEVVRMVPYLLVMLFLSQAVMPGTVGTFRRGLDPSFVIAEQSSGEGTGTGRIADLGPALSEWSSKPLFGQGLGTRVTSQDGVQDGAQILDDQWLGTLLEIGLVGALALLWLFVRAIRRLARRARAAPGAAGWLATCLAASVTSFAVGMLTFDAFAFIQVTFLAFIMLAFAAVALRGRDDE